MPIEIRSHRPYVYLCRTSEGKVNMYVAVDVKSDSSVSLSPLGNNKFELLISDKPGAPWSVFTQAFTDLPSTLISISITYKNGGKRGEYVLEPDDLDIDVCDKSEESDIAANVPYLYLYESTSAPISYHPRVMVYFNNREYLPNAIGEDYGANKLSSVIESVEKIGSTAGWVAPIYLNESAKGFQSPDSYTYEVMLINGATRSLDNEKPPRSKQKSGHGGPA